MSIANLQDIEAIEAIPFEQRLANGELPDSTYDMIRQGAAINPQAPALHFFLQAKNYQTPVSYNYAELLSALHQTANLFTSLGIGKDDVVSLLLPNLPETILSFWGGEAAGIINPINPLLEPEQIAEIMNAANSKVLITLAPFPKTDLWEKAEAVRAQVPSLQTVLTVDMSRYLSGIPKLIVKFMTRKARKNIQPGNQQVLDFNAKIAKQPGDKLISDRQIQPDDIASYFHTGGTTGTPKIAPHTHRNEVFDAWTAMHNLTMDNSKTVFCGLPWFHVNAVIVTGLAPLSKGATVVLGTPQGYRGEGLMPNFWNIVSHFKVNFFSGVPTVYSTLLDVPIGDNDVSSLEFALCGAAPMPAEVIREFEQRTDIRILEGYGSTEGTCASSVNPPMGDRRPGSIGLRFPYQAMKTVLLDDNGDYLRDCAVDEIGVVVIRGPNVFPGYQQAHHNNNIWIDDGDGQPWFNTGDMGRQDADGYFWLTGRRKELIIRGGHNIDPAIIEGPLHQHPAVAVAAAVGRPDARVGELPVVYVQLKPGAHADEAELLAFAAEHITERAAIPKAIHIVAEVPLTAVGKIFKPALVWKEIEHVFTQEVQAVEGVESVTVSAGAHPLHGTFVEVNVTANADVKAAIDEQLGAYSVRYQLTL